MEHRPEALLLNEPQRRHLGVTLGQIQQLLHEVGDLLGVPAARDGLVTEAADLPPGFVRKAPRLLEEVDRQITALAERFDLPQRQRSRYRWVRAVLGNAIDNLEDTRPNKLHPYGAVDPELEPALDPPLRELQRRVRELLTVLESDPA